MAATAHIDTFARDSLPPPELWPELRLDLPELSYPERLNCGVELLERRVEEGLDGWPCLISPEMRWTYGHLLEQVNRIARVLVEELGVVPGNRVLLRAPNNPMLVACWLAVMRVGAIAVTTMPLLRARELATVIDKAKVSHALCDVRLLDELEQARTRAPALQRIQAFGSDSRDGLESLARRRSTDFRAIDTAADDICLIAFTSGTTGVPKGCMHGHRDVLAICDTFSRHILRPEPDELFCGSPPLAFTFGLGGLVTFPLHAGASTLLLERASPPILAEAIAHFRATTCFTAPIGYKTILGRVRELDLSSLRKGVSAGEHLPRPIFEAFSAATGIRLIDGIGATEMLHIFISASGDDIRPGATGRAVPGYAARVVDEEGNPLPPGEIGLLEVRGPTGCRYLADDRQGDYVHDGWNRTGDAYVMDAEGYFWYQARADDMIVTSGYNVAGPEVESALLAHEAVQQCAVIGAPDAERGTIVKAFVVLEEGYVADAVMAEELQDHVKAAIAPYKCPRVIDFVAELPRTETGKLQRFRLREQERAGAGR
jgi:2-aminobenzoate-CoA ligase